MRPWKKKNDIRLIGYYQRKNKGRIFHLLNSLPTKHRKCEREIELKIFNIYFSQTDLKKKNWRVGLTPWHFHAVSLTLRWIFWKFGHEKNTWKIFMCRYRASSFRGHYIHTALKYLKNIVKIFLRNIIKFPKYFETYY